MKLNLKALTIASAIAWAVASYSSHWPTLFGPRTAKHGCSWGSRSILATAGSAGFRSVIIVTIYAALDGAVAGAVVAWLYNTFAGANQGTPAA